MQKLVPASWTAVVALLISHFWLAPPLQSLMSTATPLENDVPFASRHLAVLPLGWIAVPVGEGGPVEVDDEEEDVLLAELDEDEEVGGGPGGCAALMMSDARSANP